MINAKKLNNMCKLDQFIEVLGSAEILWHYQVVTHNTVLLYTKLLYTCNWECSMLSTVFQKTDYI